MAKSGVASELRNLDVTAFTEITEFNPYHSGRPGRPDAIPPERREFIAWDGEGQNLNGDGRPQSYVLFGCSTGDYILRDEHINVFDCLELIIRVAEDNPQAIHVAYSFNYDANQIIRSLHEPTLIRLYKNGFVNLHRPNGTHYRIEWRPSKWFQVTKYKDGYDREKNTHAKVTARIYDIFGFFTTSFVSAYTKTVGPVPAVVAAGKSNRNEFASLDREYVETYWKAEIICIRELAEELRRRLYGAGLRIRQWHGPGALATYALRTNGVMHHMADPPEPVKMASRYAYAGGRFEMYSLGRHSGPIYSMDINSAYPHGIRQLPSLAGGVWEYASGEHITSRKRFANFGVYRIRLLHSPSALFFRPDPSPVFHRDALGNISYPWSVDGWYWSPEARNVVRLRPDLYEIVEGWEFHPATEEKPFEWVETMYRTRREWKSASNPTELALKLCLNSLYGKMAQRVGWDEQKRQAPHWHQLEWAGWVTSNCRAMLWDVMRRVPYSDLIAVETDGLYTKASPESLGLVNSKELGGWEIKVYDEILYVQSGLAWLRKGDEWECKRRGLDANTFELQHCQDYLKTLLPGEKWESYTGKTTRFIGLGAALQYKAPTKVKLGVWEKNEREIKPGQNGKRVHIFAKCRACREGKTAYEAGHDMLINPRSLRDPNSHPHDIPWMNDVPPHSWREYESELQGLVVRHDN